MLPRRDGTNERTTRKDRATQLLIRTSLSFAILSPFHIATQIISFQILEYSKITKTHARTSQLYEEKLGLCLHIGDQ